VSEQHPVPRIERKALQTLGLARRAGRLAIGTEAVLKAGKARRLTVAVIARDASENARRRVAGRLGDGVPMVECGTRESLGRAVGRGRVAVLGVTDVSLGLRIISVLEGVEVGSGELRPVDSG
jgi:ribosomal protein L7Ae-like RNA K-turn-binding protein